MKLKFTPYEKALIKHRCLMVDRVWAPVVGLKVDNVKVILPMERWKKEIEGCRKRIKRIA